MAFLDSAPAGTLWWIVAALLVLAELLTGTFYLLMVAIGAAAGAIAAAMGLPFTGQLLAAALVGGAAVVIWHRLRPRSGEGVPLEANRDVNLDVGQTLHVTAWDANGWATVNYRGSAWRAKLASDGDASHDAGAMAPPGLYRVVAVRANHLVLAMA